MYGCVTTCDWHQSCQCQWAHLPEVRREGWRQEQIKERKKRKKRIRQIAWCLHAGGFCSCSRQFASNQLSRPNQTWPDLTSYEYCHYHQTEVDMLIVHLISATPSVAFLASRLHLQHLSAVLEKETCRLCSCHTVTLHHMVGKIIFIRSSLLFFGPSLIMKKIPWHGHLNCLENCYFLDNSTSSVVSSCCIREGNHKFNQWSNKCFINAVFLPPNHCAFLQLTAYYFMVDHSLLHTIIALFQQKLHNITDVIEWDL